MCTLLDSEEHCEVCLIKCTFRFSLLGHKQMYIDISNIFILSSVCITKHFLSVRMDCLGEEIAENNV